MGGGKVRVITEIGTIVEEIDACLLHLNQWAADRPLKLGDWMAEVPGFDQRVLRPTPKGVTLNISSWNFPYNVTIVPVINAVAAGNCCVMKPSEVSPTTSALLKQLVSEYLPSNAIRVVEGGVKETTDLLKLPWDHITYTGSNVVGKIVMTAAAQHLTPLTLELGGKNPTFVDKSANIDLAVERLLVGKTINAGQLCYGVDYVLVDETIIKEFSEKCAKVAHRILGDAAAQRGESIKLHQQWFNRIIAERHTERLKSYLEEEHGGTILTGGLDSISVKDKFCPFTIVLNPKVGSKLMSEEMFGPILILYSVPNVTQALSLMKSICSTPLSLYIFSSDKQYTETILQNTTSGSVGINTCAEQNLPTTIPFGGVGQSGFGCYHAKFGFDEYSHLRNMMKRTTLLPLSIVPKFALPQHNQFPAIVHPFMRKKFYTGFLPGWLPKALPWIGVAAISCYVGTKLGA